MKYQTNLYLYSFIRKHFDRADKNNDGDLSLEECMKIAKQLNVKLSEKEIEGRFKVKTHIRLGTNQGLNVIRLCI